jgi:hypothetical protein
MAYSLVPEFWNLALGFSFPQKTCRINFRLSLSIV